VTSATGAVIHDIYRVAFRRGGAHVLLAPATVQGEGAPESILRALELLQRVEGVDVVVVARGGGSADDLMAFNDEAVVRAVATCRVPVVSAVGHEVDVTLCDFAADARAATPSQAAELVVPDSRSRQALLTERHARLVRAMRARFAEGRAEHMELAAALRDPRLAIAASQQLLDDRHARLDAAMRRALGLRLDEARVLSGRLVALHPRAVLTREQAAVTRAHDRIVSATRALIARRAGDMQTLAGRLDALSPLKVLGRGYAIATRADGRAIRSIADVEPGDRVGVRVADGELVAEVRERR
jgi:exodeoxyribonuclease VII large subunit